MKIFNNKTFIHWCGTKGFMYRAFSLLLLFNFNQHSNAQNESLRFESIGFEQGLANNITSILQDSKGYIWIGTDGDGLVKYDGYSFTKYRFDPFDSTSISQNLVYTICEDKEGSIWVGTFEGLCKFDRATEKFKRYKPLANAPFHNPNIFAINEDKNGWIWVGNEGLCRFNKKTGKFLEENIDLGLKDTHGGVTTIRPDRDGELWISSASGLHRVTLTSANNDQPSAVHISHQYRFEAGNSNSISSDRVNSVFEDHAGIIWAATDDGLNSFDKKTGAFTRYQHDVKNPHSISADHFEYWFWNNIGEDQEGNLWISSTNGLNKLNKERTAFDTYYHKEGDGSSLSSPWLTALTIDRSGIMWVCTYGGGLNKVDLNQKMFGLRRNEPGNSNSLSNNNVTAIYEDRDSSGVIWIGTYGGGLTRWDKKTNQYARYRQNPSSSKSLLSDAVLSLFEDSHRHLWIGNGNGLSQLNKQTGQFTHYYGSVAKNYTDEDREMILSITEDREGLLWLGTVGNGIKSFNEKTGEFVPYYYDPADPNGISDGTAMTVFADSRDNIWIGHGSIATDRLNKKTGRFKHYKYDSHDSSSISSNIVNSFYEDTTTGTLWLGTSAGGLCSFDYSTEKFTTYTDKHGLANNSVYAILEDDNKHLWMGTENGLSRFDPTTKKFTNYDYKDGLQSNNFSAGIRNRSPGFKGKDGTLYLGGDNGFNFFNPLAIKANAPIAPVVITRFYLLDSVVKGANELNKIVLDHNQNYFSFEFSSLSFYNPGKNQYKYKLEGIDKDWVYSGTRRYAGYTDVGPGTYIFKVKATNNDGVWNEEGVSVAVIIRPPWWRTWWAYCIYGLLLIVAIIGIYRYQKQRVIQAERQKAQKKELEQAKEIEKAYHELKTTQQQLVQSEKMASLGELTAGIAHEIQNPLNFVNNFSEVNDELLKELKAEAEKGNLEEVKAIAKDIEFNSEKINHHGKRADAIVKGMLQHSRTSTGQRELTNINALADEYLRLAYHGLRAKDKSFNATMKTDFDNSIGKINVVPQEIGRVILNLINNAFYAVDEKKKKMGDGYEPIVSASTKKINDKIEIKIADNGNGIPQKVLDKIFQPFFTTKPTGQGTGLGLSLAYDIVKAHGGEIKVQTKEGEGSEFIIQMPTTSSIP